MAKLREDQRAWLISWTCQWLDAVDRQAGRALDVPDPGKGQVEILLFVVALRNVLRGAEAILGKEHAAVRSFYEAVPGARDIRDMLEHFDEYVPEAVDSREASRPTGWCSSALIVRLAVNAPSTSMADRSMLRLRPWRRGPWWWPR